MINQLTTLDGSFNGLNLNPVPLTIENGLTTIEYLMALLAKMDEVITFTNTWYAKIIEDLENNGVLYDKLNESFLAQFGVQITALENSITTINNLIDIINDSITLLQYKEPSLSLTTNSGSYLFAVGAVINGIQLNYNVVKGSNDLIKAEIYKNGTLLTTINNVLNGVNNYVDGSPITSDTIYYVKVFDDNGNVSSNEIKFTFIHKIFYGKISNNSTVTEPLIQSLNNITVIDKFDFNVSLNDEKIIIVAHDILDSIIDSDNLDIIESFTMTTINLTINNVSTQYNVYVSTNAILENNIKLTIIK